MVGSRVIAIRCLERGRLGLEHDLCAGIVARGGMIRGLDDKPLEGATDARFSNVGAYLSGDFDDARCASLLRGLIWARPMPPRASPPSSRRGGRTITSIPYAYVALKPVFTPDRTLRNIRALPKTARLLISNG